MKKIATILLAVLLFCSCGVTCRECVTDPYKIYVKETSGTNAVFLVEMDSDIELELRKIIIQRFEDDRWVVLESLKEYISPEELEFPKKGKTAEWNIEFEDVYGELPTGKYRALFHGNRYDADKKYSWYYKAEFSIDNPNYEKAGPKTLDITAESHGWNRACGNQNLPSIEDAVPGFAVSFVGLFIGMFIKIWKRKVERIKEDAKFTEQKMKEFDAENNDEIIKKYISKKCTVDILEPLAKIDDKKAQLILREINNTTLLYALAGASGKVCAKFMRNLSVRMLRFLDEQLQTEEFEEENVREAQIQILQIASLIK